MRHRDDSHVDEWAALVGEDVGERVAEPSLTWRESRAPPPRYHDEPGPRGDR
ncbi:hypothetical protein [Halorientalis regularis]|uniref:hypothetical protein n=1 Tax=Halorientalis regularis TaxID=660518 RepID=UPI001587ACA1|nr:hypothetical protein [Halorientalis regularis]